MTLSFPLGRAEFAALLKIVDAPMRLVEFVEISGSADGNIREAELAEPIWFCEALINSVPVEHAEWVQTMVEALGAGRDFYMINTRRPYPLLDPTGSTLGSSTPTLSQISSNNRSIRVDGLPANYVLSVGDMLSWDYGSSQRALHRIIEGAQADGFGLTPFFELRPPLRAGTVVDVDVIFNKPSAKMRVVPGSFLPGSRSGNIVSGMSFSAYEVVT